MTHAIILAAGSGSRLNGASGGTPKCLVEVGGKPLIRHSLEMLASAGVDSVCVVIGYQAEQVRAAVGDSCNFVENPDYADTNSLYSFALCKNWISDSTLVMNCDVLAHPEILRHVLAVEGSAFAYDSSRGWEEEDMKVLLQDGRLRTMSKALPPDEAHGENVGILKFDKDTIRRLVCEAEVRIDSGGAQDWFPAAVAKIASKVPIRGVDIAGLPWTEIDFPDDLQCARTEIWPAICRQADAA